MNKLLNLCYKYEISIETSHDTLIDGIRFRFSRQPKYKNKAGILIIRLPIIDLENLNSSIESFLYSKVVEQFDLKEE